MTQLRYKNAEQAARNRREQREKSLAETKYAVMWARLEAVIETRCLRIGRAGLQPIGMAKMPRKHNPQQPYALANKLLDGALHNTLTLREIVGIHVGRATVPDATKVIRFRRLLNEPDLTPCPLRVPKLVTVRTWPQP